MFGLKIRGVQAPPLDPLLMLVNVMIERSGGYLGGYLFRLKTDSNGVDSTPQGFSHIFPLEQPPLFSDCSKRPRDEPLPNPLVFTMFACTS